MPYYSSALQPNQRPYKEYRSPGQIEYDFKRAPLEDAEMGKALSIFAAIVSCAMFALAEYWAAHYKPIEEVGKEKAAKMKKNAQLKVHIVGSSVVLVSIVCVVYFFRSVSKKQAAFAALKLVRP